MNPRTISVVIPALNEARGIADVVAKCHNFADEVIVVDGGSTDATVEHAKKEGAIVVAQPERGYGLALLTGFDVAAGAVVATADGDGTYPVQLIPQLARLLMDLDLDFISGSRFPLAGRASMNVVNRMGNQAFTLLASLLWMHRFQDILSGMWVFRRNCLSKLKLCSLKWDLSQEIKLEAHARLRFREMHIPYYERVGESKLYPFKVGLENLIYFFAQRFGVRSLIFPQAPVQWRLHEQPR